MGLLKRLLEGNEWSGDVAHTLEVKEKAKQEIAQMSSKIDEIEDKIIEISFLMERQPNPKTDGEMLDWIGDLRSDQRYYRDRIALLEKCIKRLDDYIASVRPQVN
jgi:Mg2+ and Co2+ transporter CorA